jgi:hypothetical protein
MALGLELLHHVLIAVSAFITGWLWRGWWTRRHGHGSHTAETPEEDPRG